MPLNPEARRARARLAAHRRWHPGDDLEGHERKDQDERDRQVSYVRIHADAVGVTVMVSLKGTPSSTNRRIIRNSGM